MYGQYEYGALQFGDIDKESTFESYETDLLKHLPSFWHDVKEMNELQAVAGSEIGTLKYNINELLKQFFASEATWGLAFWEKELGISTDPTQPYIRRREIILAKLRGSGTVTKTMVKSVAAAFSGGDVEVIEYPQEYRFEVKFIGVKGIPANIAGFIEMLEQIKPAHLTYSLKYTYTVWNVLNNLTWNQAGAKTWNELKIYEGE